MPRDERAYLADIVDACDAIASAVCGLDLAGSQANRLVRSSVEREFIIVGDALTALSRVAPQVFWARLAGSACRVRVSAGYAYGGPCSAGTVEWR